MEDPQASELKLFVVANWKFSILVGGLISLLTVLYAGTLFFGLIVQAVRAAQRLAGDPPERRWLVKFQ